MGKALTYAERTLVAGGFEDGLIAGVKGDAGALRDARKAYAEFRARYGYANAPARMLTRPDAQAKLAKSERYALGLMLTPADALPEEVAIKADLRRKFTLCSDASAGCRAACLAYSGHGAFNATQRARQVRTAFLLAHPFHAGALIASETAADARKYGAGNVTLRLNVLSDIRWEYVAPDGLAYLTRALGVILYDYTAHAPDNRDATRIEGYALTYSAKESAHTSDAYIRSLLSAGHNVAVPFHVGKRDPLPTSYVFDGVAFDVIDGDLTDDRTTDPVKPVGVIVGLRAKGARGKADASGFIRTV